MKNPTDVQAPTPEQLVNELRSLVTEAEKILGQSEPAHSQVTLAALRERCEAAQQRFTDLYGEAKKKASAGAKYADETIRENPYQSLAIAAGLGVLLGILIGRRTKTDA